MNDRQWNAMKRILSEERAVRRSVAVARPYIRYDRGDKATVYADGRWSSIPPHQQGPVFTRTANLDDGIIITKYAVPGCTLSPPLPQMRPDHPVRIRLKPDDREGHIHSTYGPKVRELHVKGASHSGEDTEGLHSHAVDGTAKYLLAPKGYVDLPYEHEHSDKTSNGHLRKEHGGQPQSGDHQHVRHKKDERVSPEKRLDMNPLAAEKLADAERVFFSIEGSIKADALLSKGECAFAVPSVTMWTAPELDKFAREHLRGKRTYVVPDADWASNPLVACQAFLCADYLTKRGVREAVASSPDPRFKGIDDWLAARGTVAAMRVQERRMSAGFKRWARAVRDDPEVRERMRDQRSRERLVDVVRLLAMLADDNGLVVRPGRSLCQYVGFSIDRLRAVVHRMEMAPEMSPMYEWDFSGPDDWNTVYGPLADPFIYVGDLDGPWWTTTPVFELRPDLRTESVEYQLGDSPP